MAKKNKWYNLCRQPCFALFCLIGTGLGGCATDTDMQLAQSHLHTPLKILVLQTPLKIKASKLQKALAPKSKKKLALSAPVIAEGIQHSQEYAMIAMISDLRHQPKIRLIAPPAAASTVIDAIQRQRFAQHIPQPLADQIHSQTGADAILRFGITDYGLTPSTWRSGYITFEVVSTLAITAAIASVGTSLAKGTAGAYLAQETVEETAESYAGFWGLDVVCRPVRIEAELIQLHPVKQVWTDNDTGLSDVSLSRLTRKVSSQERNMQLDHSTNDAVGDVVSDLADALKNLEATH